MAPEKHQLRVNQRVKLKSDGQDAPYAFATAGSEGWIRGLDHDHVGFPVVRIEWDKDHWTYNGEEDQWTLEAHFEPVEGEDKMDDGNEQIDPELLKALSKFLKTQIIDDEPKAPSFDKKYQEELERAIEEAKGADSFLLLTVKKKGSGDSPLYDPKIFQFFKTEETGLVLEIQLTRLGAIAHESVTVDAIKRLLHKDES